MGTDKISIVGLDKAAVLAALYNASRPQGMGFLHYDPTPMSTEEAQQLLKQYTHFDYLKGRVMKIDLSGDEVCIWSYDRDNGQGAAARIIDDLRKTNDTNSVEVQAVHQVGRNTAAKDVMAHIHEETTIERQGGIAVATLGLADVANHLIPKVERFADED